MFVFPAHKCHLKPWRLPLSEEDFAQDERDERTNDSVEREEDEEGEFEENEVDADEPEPEGDMRSNNNDVASSFESGRPQRLTRLCCRLAGP